MRLYTDKSLRELLEEFVENCQDYHPESDVDFQLDAIAYELNRRIFEAAQPAKHYQWLKVSDTILMGANGIRFIELKNNDEVHWCHDKNHAGYRSITNGFKVWEYLCSMALDLTEAGGEVS